MRPESFRPVPPTLTTRVAPFATRRARPSPASQPRASQPHHTEEELHKIRHDAGIKSAQAQHRDASGHFTGKEEKSPERSKRGASRERVRDEHGRFVSQNKE